MFPVYNMYIVGTHIKQIKDTYMIGRYKMITITTKGEDG